MLISELDRTPPALLGADGRDGLCPECRHEPTGVELRKGPTTCARAIDYGMGDIDDCGCTNIVHASTIVPDYVR